MVKAKSIDGMSRRQFLAKAAAATSAGAFMSVAGPVIEKAFGAGPCSGHLSDIEHFVLLMQENRSFDHYFGTLSGVNGFDAPSPSFRQKGWNPQTQSTDPNGVTLPFRFDTTRGPLVQGECTNDPVEGWIAMHTAWNNGANDQWLPSQYSQIIQGNIPGTMGYFTRADLPIHYLLADAFTICDSYFCSLLGGTDPNRLYWLSATVDPDGLQGGPVLVNPSLASIPLALYSWTIMPENLSAAGVSWKVYNNRAPGTLNNTPLGDSGLVEAFKQSQDPRSDLARYGIVPNYPVGFAADVVANKLPNVSWLVPSFTRSEHPAFPVATGAVTLVDTIRILLSNPAVWEKTALIIMYDECGSFFDHVVPPTAPPGTPGEWVPPSVDINKVSGSGGIRGPIGLGYRVPCFVISPYSRGGLVCHDTFDHTSQLRLLETRFGVPVPNLSAWRRSTTRDMTSAFNFAVPPNPSKPNLDHPLLAALPKLPQCVPNGLLGSLGGAEVGVPYRVPYPQAMPTQETSPSRGIPSGLC